MNEIRFNALIQELIEENPFAVRAVLKILEIRFTESVPTLAVTAEDTPRMLVNLAFLKVHCQTDQHVKAVICHEFLHVLLRHTEAKTRMTPARHLALDAVINAIIHRQYGPEYSSTMASYYGEATDMKKLLRPMNEEEETWYWDRLSNSTQLPQWAHAWPALYQGGLIADDIESLAMQVSQPSGEKGRAGQTRHGPFELERDGPWNSDDLLGNHNDIGKVLPEVLESALETTIKEMNGAGIWRKPKSRGVGANPYEALFTAKNEPLVRWQKKTLAILKRHLVPDRRSRTCRTEPHTYRIPVLSPGDRRAFFRTLWAPFFLPEAKWSTELPRRSGTAQALGYGPGLPRCLRFHERRDVTDRRAARQAVTVYPAPVLGVQRHRCSRPDRTGPTHLDNNGQTGRKLVVDFYGPRIPIGGGALSGKHLSHIDRIGAYAAREAAVRAVQSGAQECLVRLAYAPTYLSRWM